MESRTHLDSPPQSPRKQAINTVLTEVTDNLNMPVESLNISSIHSELAQCYSSTFFRTPVDPVALEIPDYFETIDKPMDLSTIEQKIAATSSYTLEDLTVDVSQIVINATTYNPAGHPVHSAALDLFKDFRKLYTRASGRDLELLDVEGKRSKRSTQRPLKFEGGAPATIPSLSARSKRKSNANIPDTPVDPDHPSAKTSSRKPKRQRKSQSLSALQISQLPSRLSLLDESQTHTMVQILQNRSVIPIPEEGVDLEVELDLDALDDIVLMELWDFCEKEHIDASVTGAICELDDDLFL